MTPSDRPGRWRDLLIVLTLISLTVAVYSPVRNYGFVNYDDPDYVFDNPLVKRGLTLDGVKWALTSSYASNWHPLTWISLMVDCQVFGPQPGPIHLHNVLLHAINAALLFWVLQRMTGALWLSAFAAALFAWHPLRVESVAWISERKDVLSGLFWLLTLWTWLRFTERRTRWRYLGSLLLFALGLMSKPMLITLPCVLLLLDFWPLKRVPIAAARAAAAPPPVPARLPWTGLLLEKVPFFALSFGTAVVTLFSQRGGGAMTYGDSLSYWQRIGNAAVAYVEYLRKFIWPHDLAVFYPHPGQWPLWRIGAATAALALATAVVVRQRRSRPYLLVGWLWYLGTLTPTLGLVQVGGQAWADRYTYVPMIGVAIVLTWGIADISGRRRWPVGVREALAATILAASLLATVSQLPYWQNTRTLFEHALEVTENNHRAHKELADVFSAERQFTESNRHYEEALRIKPLFFTGQMNYATSLGNQGRIAEAIPHLRVAIQVNPNSAEAHNNLGLACEMTGAYDEARQQYREALAVRPNFPTAQRNLSRLGARRQ